jgi:hypothetical protein
VAAGPDAHREADAGSLRELLEARIRDPKTSARDLASLSNALARLPAEQQRPAGPSIADFQVGTLIVEPDGSSRSRKRRFRFMVRTRGGRIVCVPDSACNLTAYDAFVFTAFWLREMISEQGDDAESSPEQPQPEPVDTDSRDALPA